MLFDTGCHYFSIAIHDQGARSAGPNIYSEEFDLILRAFQLPGFGLKNEHPKPRPIRFNKLF